MPDTQDTKNTTNTATSNTHDPETHFYQFYLDEHQNIHCRRLHFLGSTLGLLCFLQAIIHLSPLFILYGFLAGYACAWVGHFFFEKNKPATFKYPLQSFLGDWRMYADIWRGRISLMDASRDKI